MLLNCIIKPGVTLSLNLTILHVGISYSQFTDEELIIEVVKRLAQGQIKPLRDTINI